VCRATGWASNSIEAEASLALLVMNVVDLGSTGDELDESDVLRSWTVSIGMLSVAIGLR
jgi:hypothetical protein